MLALAKSFIAASSIFFGLSCLTKSKRSLLLMQIFSSTFYGLHCFFVHAYVGGIVTIFDLTRVLIFYLIEKRNGTQKQKLISASVLFIAAIVCSIFSWEGWYSALPLAATLVFIICLAISRLLVLKFATLFSSINSIIYLFLAGSKFGAMLELIPLFCAIVGIVASIINMRRTKTKKGE